MVRLVRINVVGDALEKMHLCIVQWASYVEMPNTVIKVHTQRWRVLLLGDYER